MEALERPGCARCLGACRCHTLLDYLQGQVIPGTANGWTLITVDGLSLGWAKGSGGQLKNHFPKGLRWMNA